LTNGTGRLAVKLKNVVIKGVWLISVKRKE